MHEGVHRDGGPEDERTDHRLQLLNARHIGHQALQVFRPYVDGETFLAAANGLDAFYAEAASALEIELPSLGQAE
jgi:hypothetical protein